MPFSALLLDQNISFLPQISHLLREVFSSYNTPSAPIRYSLWPLLGLTLIPALPVIIQHAIYLTSLLKTSPFLESQLCGKRIFALLCSQCGLPGLPGLEYYLAHSGYSEYICGMTTWRQNFLAPAIHFSPLPLFLLRAWPTAWAKLVSLQASLIPSCLCESQSCHSFQQMRVESPSARNIPLQDN